MGLWHCGTIFLIKYLYFTGSCKIKIYTTSLLNKEVYMQASCEPWLSFTGNFNGLCHVHIRGILSPFILLTVNINVSVKPSLVTLP